MGLFHHHPHHADDPVSLDTPAALGNHAMGIELQLLELSERRERAVAQHDEVEVRRIDREVEALEAELADVGMRLGA